MIHDYVKDDCVTYEQTSMMKQTNQATTPST